MRWRLFFVAVALSSSAGFQVAEVARPRVSVFGVTFEAELLSKRKKDLAELCRDAGLKVSGTKPQLVERLVAHQAMQKTQQRRELEELQQYQQVSAPQSREEAEAAVEAVVAAVVAAQDKVNPDILTSQREVLLEENGALFERVANRNVSPDARGAIALVRGFVSGELKIQSRDAVRFVLRTAIEAPQDIDRCFKTLADKGKLDAPLLAYVDDLLNQQQYSSERDSGSLLTKVLTIIKDRIEAERHVSKSEELRTLAEAIRIQDPKARKQFVQTALGRSLDFAQRFETYVSDAATFVASHKVSTHLDSDAIKDVHALVLDFRQSMPV